MPVLVKKVIDLKKIQEKERRERKAYFDQFEPVNTNTAPKKRAKKNNKRRKE